MNYRKTSRQPDKLRLCMFRKDSDYTIPLELIFQMVQPIIPKCVSFGEIASGKKYWADGTPVAGQQFDYTFDDKCGNQ